MTERAFHLGSVVADGGTAEPFLLDGDDLTTHGVIVGMTGSGKTGLGMILLEEALAAGVPVLAIDPKGDMGNLLLSAPGFAPAAFARWIDPAKAAAEGVSIEALAARTAARWRDGVAGSGVPRERHERVAAVPKTLFTPGSTAGVPMNLLGSLAAPPTSWSAHEEALRDEIEGLVSGLLGMAGIDSHPVTGREHVLLAHLVEDAWRQGRDLDLPALLAGIDDPPFRKLGVLEIDSFYPLRKRRKLMLRLNGLLASPSFAPWMQGPPFEPHALLGGDPRATIVSIAHLSEPERMAAVAVVLSRIVTWMRGEPGRGDLRCLLYMDEVFGFAPPTAVPPSKKPLLTLLKQARAYGVGLVLATQNPVDLDYKAMSNSGTWLVGRLQTERDKARILDGLETVGGTTPASTLDDWITGLDKREFLFHSVRGAGPLRFATRWALSYLAGPLTLAQIARLTADDPARDSAATATVGDAERLADDESTVPPPVADSVDVAYVHPSAPWPARMGADPLGGRLRAGLAARVHAHYDDRSTGLSHDEMYELVLWPLGAELQPEAALPVDYDDRDFVARPPVGAVYVLPEAPVDSQRFFSTARSAIRDHLVRSRRVELLRNRRLGAVSRPGESEAEFRERLAARAAEMADRDADKERRRVEKKMRRLENALAAAELRRREAEVDLRARKQDELVTGAGAVISALLGGRGSTRSLVRRASRAVSAASRRRGRTARAEQRVDALEDREHRQADDLAALEADLVARLEAIDAEWAAAAAEVEVVAVGLEKSDVDVTSLSLFWLARAG